MTAYIGYNNILETGTITVTSEATGFEKENAYDWLTFDYWKPTSAGTVYYTVDMGADVTVDYWALGFQDLYNHSGKVRAEYSSDNFSADINPLSLINLVPDSESFDSTNWLNLRSSVTADATTSPDGTVSADKLIESIDNGTHYTYQNLSLLAGVYTFSIYLKAGEKADARVSLYNPTDSTYADSYFDLSLGTITSTTTGTASIEDVGSGWYRCSVTGTATVDTVIGVNPSRPQVHISDPSLSYTGDGSSGIYLWGAQVEQASTVGTYESTDFLNITNSDLIFKKVSSTTARYFRLAIQSTTTPSAIGALSFGQITALPRGIRAPVVSPKNGRDHVILNSISEGSQFLGRSIIKNGYKFAIKQENVTEAWMDANWDNLIDHIEIKPFFYLWDQTNRPTEAVFAWASKAVKSAVKDRPGYYNFTIECKGLI